VRADVGDVAESLAAFEALQAWFEERLEAAHAIVGLPNRPAG
jgi:hypothetical protein